MAVTIRGSGQLITQIQSVTVTSSFTTTSTSFTDITGLSVTITPTNSANKILVIWNTCGASASGAASTGAYLNLLRGSTQIYIGDAIGSAIRNTGSLTTRLGADQNYINAGGAFLDSPATTSPTTYKLQILSANGNTVYVNRSEVTSYSFSGSSPSTITVMEIAYA
jgi:hypothetical protein